MEELIEKMNSLLDSYRKHEGNGDFRISKQRINKWILQFDESDREFVLTELNNIFDKMYYSPARAARLYILMLTKSGESLGYKELSTFLDNSVFINCQLQGKSQSEILSLLEIVLGRNKYDIKNVGSISKKH